MDVPQKPPFSTRTDIPLDQTIGELHYGGYDSPYPDPDERRPWVRVWEWLTRPSPPRD